MASLVPSQYSASTLGRYNTSLSHTIRFIQSKYKVSDINIRNVDHEFITDYDFFLRSKCKCANNTVVKYLKNFKKIIRVCIFNEWLDKDPFANYRGKLRETSRVFLGEKDLRMLFNKEFAIERINQVKDVFMFSCLTGLAYSDIKKLTMNNVSVGIDGRQWLFVIA